MIWAVTVLVRRCTGDSHGIRRRGMLVGLLCVAAFLAAGLGPMTAPVRAEARGADTRPNFVLIMVDDAGFMDFGVCGGEAATPNIDRLAGNGVLFTNYHTSPLCAPSRAMLLTGVDNHRTGVATIPEILPPELRGRPGYSMHLERGVVTVASRLKAAGYRTYMTGKWHLGDGAGNLPDSHGFDRSFALAASGADNWEQKAYIPYYDKAPWYEDGRPAKLPKDFYSSRFIVDRMIDYLDSGKDEGRPFFAYLAFQALHIPVQAPPEFTAKYKGVYDKGWQAVREARWRRARELGLIPEDAPLAPMLPMLRKWEGLSEQDRRIYAKSMAVNAGMLDAMDHHIGRLLAYLEEKGKLDNTIFIITSDNGPAPSNPFSSAAAAFKAWMRIAGYSRKLENLGEKGSFVFIGPEWAEAAASPGAFFKWQVGEGGLHVPLIISGPGFSGPRRVGALSFVSDVTPTILDLAGVEGDGEGTVPMTGRSLLPLLRGQTEAVYGPDHPVGIEVSGQAALFRGHYKLERNTPPYGDGVWRLYDITRDPGETRNLADERPDLFSRLMSDYQAYTRKMGVLETPKGYNMYEQLRINTIRRAIRFHWVAVLAVAVGLVGLCALFLLGLRAAFRRLRSAA